MDRRAQRHGEGGDGVGHAVAPRLAQGDGDGRGRGGGAQGGEIGRQHRGEGPHRVLPPVGAGHAVLDAEDDDLEEQDDDDHPQEGLHDGEGLAGVGEIEEDAEDVQRQQRDDDPLDELRDDGAELDEALAQDPSGDHAQADAEDEGQQQRGHDLERRRHLDGEVGLQGAARLLDVAQRGARQESREDLRAHEVGDEAGEERRGVGQGRRDAEPLPGAAPEVGDGRGDEPDDDERDREGEELAEQVGEGREDAAGADGQQVVAADAHRAQHEGEDDGGEHPHEDAALGQGSAELGHGGPFGAGGGADRRSPRSGFHTRGRTVRGGRRTRHPGPPPSAGPGDVRVSALRAQQREEDGLADPGVGEQHDEPVDPEAEAAHGRAALLEGGQEVLVELHGLGVAGRGGERLGGEDLALDDGVDELAEAGAALHAADDEVPGLDAAGLGAVAAGQRLGDLGVVADEGGRHQVLLDELAEELDDHLLRTPALVEGDAVGPRGVAQLLQRGLGRDPPAEPVGQPLVDRQPGPLAVEVDDAAPGLDPVDAEGVGDVHDDRPEGLGDRELVAPALIGLEHRELGAVRGVDALVAEDPADLVDAVGAAHHDALEVQLEGDAQVHVDVEGVQVGGEGPRRRAAVQGLEHRPLDLQVALGLQRLADGAGDARPGAQHGARLGADDEVVVALAHARLLGQLLVEHRQGPQRLRGEPPLGRHDRQLTAPGRDDPPAHPHEVAQVDLGLPGRQGLVADLGAREHDLEALGVGVGGEAVLEGGEAKPAGVAEEDDAPADGHLVVRLLAGLQTGPAGPHLREGVRPAQVDRIGLDAALEAAPALGGAHAHLLGKVLLGPLAPGVGRLLGTPPDRLPWRPRGATDAGCGSPVLAHTGDPHPSRDSLRLA